MSIQPVTLIQISHKLNLTGLERKIMTFFCLKTTYKIAAKINVGNCNLTKSNDKVDKKCNDFSSTKTRLKL